MSDVCSSVLGDGNDTLIGGSGADTLIGGAGSDTASYAGSSGGVTVDLAAGTGSGGDAQGDTLSGIENLTGSSQGDRSEEHTSELQSLMRISYAVLCLQKKRHTHK